MSLFRRALRSARLFADCYSRITAYRGLARKAGAASKQRDLDVQEFFWILPEVANEQAHISGQARQIVVQLGVRKQLSRGSCVVVQFCGGRSKIRAGVTQLVIKGVVRDQLAQRALDWPIDSSVPVVPAEPLHCQRTNPAVRVHLVPQLAVAFPFAEQTDDGQQGCLSGCPILPGADPL